jgi:hypothetical protein
LVAGKQANLGTSVNVAYSIKIALQIFGMQDGEPTSATRTTRGVRLSQCLSRAKGINKLHDRNPKGICDEITDVGPPCILRVFV